MDAETDAKVGSMQKTLEHTELSESGEPVVQQVSPVMHWWFLVDTALVFIAGAQLFVLSELTHLFFAWTIPSAMTAAFLGAAYWSSIPMLLNSFRQQVWANARIAVLGVWFFTTLTLILTLQYWNRFNWQSEFVTAQFATWVWLGIYILVPVGLLISWFFQRRLPGGDPPRTKPLPAWFRGVLGVQAFVMLSVGLTLYFSPTGMIPMWPWTLTSLTAGAIGAWTIGIGLTTAQTMWENDWRRINGSVFAFALLGVLQLVAIARYAGQIDWTNRNAWLYLGFIVSILIVGSIGIYLWRKNQSQ